jgi:hypothetical protein
MGIQFSLSSMSRGFPDGVSDFYRRGFDQAPRSQPLPPPPPPPAGEVPSPDEYRAITSLSQVRHLVGDIIPYALGRARLISLYTGLRNDEWFLYELIDNFRLLLDYRAGLTFLLRITEKIIDKCDVWDETILLHFSQMLKMDRGCELIREFIGINHQQAAVVNKSFFLLSNLEDRPDDAYRNMIVGIIQTYNDSMQVLHPLVQTDWERVPARCFYLRALIEFCPEHIWAPLISKFVQSPGQFVKDFNTAAVVVAILRRGRTADRDAIFDSLLPFFDVLAVGDPEWKVAHELVSVGTVQQKAQIADAMEKCLRMLSRIEPHVEEVFVHLLWALPLTNRLELLERTKDTVPLLNSPRITEIVAYIGIIVQM